MITGVDVTDTKAVFETMVPLVTSPVDYVINNAGYFWEEHFCFGDFCGDFLWRFV